MGLGFYGLRFRAYSRLFGNWLSLAIMRLLCDMTYLWALHPTSKNISLLIKSMLAGLNEVA